MKPEEIKELKKKVKQSLDVDRHTLVMKFPFIGGISLKMNLIPVRDSMCPTACTDGKNVYFDCAFYTELGPKERVFVLAHEIWHCVMLHLARRQTRDPQLFNIATDMEVNHLLAINSKDGILTPPKDVLFPPHRLEGKSAEEIYDWLLKQANKMKNQSSGFGESSFSDNRSSSSSISSSKSKTNKSKSSDDGSSGEIGQKLKDALSGKSGKDNGKLSGQFDKHKYQGDGDDTGHGSSGNGDGEDGQSGQGKSKQGNLGYPTRKDKYGEVGRDDDFQPNVSDDFAEEMRETVISQAQQCQRTAGGMPLGLESLLEKLDKPEIPWQEVLAQFVTSCYNGKRRWLPPSRRHVYNEMYFQSRRDEKLKVAVAVDTSGSCIGDLPKFFGELNGLLKSFGQYELIVIQNDYKISSVDRYDDTNPFPDDPKKIKWVGGGGTSFSQPFIWIRENKPDIDCMCFFTDGFECFTEEAETLKTPPPYPVLWILTADGNEDCCEWGRKLKFKNVSSSYDD